MYVWSYLGARSEMLSCCWLLFDGISGNSLVCNPLPALVMSYNVHGEGAAHLRH